MPPGEHLISRTPNLKIQSPDTLTACFRGNQGRFFTYVEAELTRIVKQRPGRLKRSEVSNVVTAQTRNPKAETSENPKPENSYVRRALQTKKP